MRARLLILVLVAVAVAPARSRARLAYLDVPAAIVRVGGASVARLPLLIVLPPTGTAAAAEYGSFAPHVKLADYAVILPAGVPARADYADFHDYVSAFEVRIDADVRRARAQLPIDETRVYLAGFSLGGDLAWAMLVRHPERYRGALVLGSGCSVSLSRRAAAALRERDARVVLGVGDDDTRRAGMARAEADAHAAAISTRRLRYAGGHALPVDAVLDDAFRALFD
jgi:predicted esterase